VLNSQIFQTQFDQVIDMCKWTILDKIIAKTMAIDLHSKMQKVEELIVKLKQQLIELWHLQAFHYQPRRIEHECGSWEGFHYRKVEYLIRANWGEKSPHGFGGFQPKLIAYLEWTSTSFFQSKSCSWKRGQGRKKGQNVWTILDQH
jgi:hypothetical protein